MSSGKIHCYIIISTELKQKHTFEQDELFCCVIFSSGLKESWTSLVAQMVKRLPTMPETQVQFLGLEDLLEKEMVTTPVFLPVKSHGGRSLVGQRVGHD